MIYNIHAVQPKTAGAARRKQGDLSPLLPRNEHYADTM